MNYQLTKDVEKYLYDSLADAKTLLKDLCAIPAPSHFEGERAEFIKKWLIDNGAKGVYIDDAKNVVLPINCENSRDITCFEAHTDTVFPIETPLPFMDDGEKLYCPGIGDDTANLVAMLIIIRYIIKNGLAPKNGILFVANSCEEGLGNLKGTRQIFSDWKDRITSFCTFDGYYSCVADRCVGSHRYSIEITTQGGHSWSRFGNCNAITELAKLICNLSSVTLPEREGTKTTYNFGTIEGGTSVNTIAQNASMLYEYRSDNAECLAYMKDYFIKSIETFRQNSCSNIKVTLVGDRPCGEAKDKALQEKLVRRAIEVSEKHYGQKVSTRSSSTDCNIPLSFGVAAICAGLVLGEGAHTREEWIYTDSISVGLKIAAEIILDYFI